MKKEKFPVIEVEASGKRNWSGGAWCLVWVYAKEGNFLLKGYIKECEEYIEKRGWKCWAVFNMYHTEAVPFYKAGKSGENFRTIIRTFKCNFDIYLPWPGDKRKKADDWKIKIYEKGNSENSIKIKRLPSKFVDFKPPKFEGRPGSLGSMDALKSLKDKLNQG